MKRGYMKLIALLLKLINAIRASFVKPMPGNCISSLVLMQRIYEQKWSLPVGMLDSSYYYTDRAGWAEIISDIVFKSPLYLKNRFDCENFAFRFMSLCAERYGLNADGVIIGDTPEGRHAWSAWFDGKGFFYVEPQTGEVFEVGENKYIGDMFVI